MKNFSFFSYPAQLAFGSLLLLCCTIAFLKIYKDRIHEIETLFLNSQQKEYPLIQSISTLNMVINHANVLLLKNLNENNADINESRLEVIDHNIPQIMREVHRLDSAIGLDLWHEQVISIDDYLDQLNTLHYKIYTQSTEISYDGGIDVFNYPYIVGDTILATIDFQNWLNDQVSTQEMGAGYNSITTYISELVPLQLKLIQEGEHFQDVIRQSIVSKNQIMTKRFDENILLFYSCVGIAVVLFGINFIVFSKRWSKPIREFVDQIKILNEGNYPTIREMKEPVYRLYQEEVKRLVHHLTSIQSFAMQVSTKEYSTEIDIFKNSGEIGQSLIEMHESLKNVAKEDQSRIWTNEGLHYFSEISNKNQNLQLFCEAIISELVKFAEVAVGNLYIKEELDDQSEILELKACYAYDRNKFLTKQISPGQGLVGQCWKEKKSTYLENIPANYIRIRSGLGASSPKYLYICPMLNDQEVVGIVEIASYDFISSTIREFIDKLCNNLAAKVSSVKINEKTNLLLAETTEKTEQMRAQEEEMRQNVEELQATQEEMLRNAKEAEQQTLFLGNLLNSIEYGIIAFNTNEEIVFINQITSKTLAYSQQELINKKIDQLVGIHDLKDLINQRNSDKPFECTLKMKIGNSIKVQAQWRKVMLFDHAYYVLQINSIGHDDERAGESLTMEQTISNHWIKNYEHFIETDELGIITNINNSYLEYLSKKRVDVLGVALELFFEPNFNFEHYAKELFEQNKPIEAEWEIKCIDKTKRWEKIYLIPFKPQSNTKRILIISFDITKWKSMMLAKPSVVTNETASHILKTYKNKNKELLQQLKSYQQQLAKILTQNKPNS